MCGDALRQQPFLAQQARHFVDGSGLSGGHDDLRAGACENRRDGQADATRGTGDEGNTAGQVVRESSNIHAGTREWGVRGNCRGSGTTARRDVTAGAFGRVARALRREGRSPNRRHAVPGARHARHARHAQDTNGVAGGSGTRPVRIRGSCARPISGCPDRQSPVQVCGVRCRPLADQHASESPTSRPQYVRWRWNSLRSLVQYAYVRRFPAGAHLTHAANRHVDRCRRPPAKGPHEWRAHHRAGWQAGRSRQPHHPVHRGRRHGSGHLARIAVRVRRRGEEGVRHQATHRLVRSARRREVQGAHRQLAARRDTRRHLEAPCRYQGSAHDAGRRRLPLAERDAAPAARPVRVREAGPLLHRRALAGEAPRGHQHGDLPREHRGHLRRDRVAGGRRPRRAR